MWLLVERGEGRRDETVSDCVETAALGGWNLLVVDFRSLLSVLHAFSVVDGVVVLALEDSSKGVFVTCTGKSTQHEQNFL